MSIARKNLFLICWRDLPQTVILTRRANIHIQVLNVLWSWMLPQMKALNCSDSFTDYFCQLGLVLFSLFILLLISMQVCKEIKVESRSRRWISGGWDCWVLQAHMQPASRDGQKCWSSSGYWPAGLVKTTDEMVHKKILWHIWPDLLKS